MVVVHLSFLGRLDACFHIRWVHMVLRHGPVAVLYLSPPHKASCACPIFLTGLGLVLDSQFIYMVGYEFPTMVMLSKKRELKRDSTNHREELKGDGGVLQGQWSAAK